MTADLSTPPPPAAALPTVDLLGVEIHAITERGAIDHVLAELAAGRGGWVATPNLDHLRRLCTDPAFRTLCREASLLVPDGVPLLWASRLQGTPLPGRVAGSDLISSLSAAAARAGRSLFLLGGDPGTAEAATATLRDRHPGLRVVGHHCPPFGFESDAAEMERIRTVLRQTAPDIVFVALGSPKQERLMHELCGVLPGAWWVGVGISFSFLTGDVKRAPVWLQRIGLEWLHRLVQEPKRLAGRYLWHGVPFAVRLLAGSAWRRVSRPRPAPPSRPRG